MKNKSAEPTVQSVRRWYTLQAAAEYIGYSVDFFNKHVRTDKRVIAIPMGESKTSPVSFDVHDLDDYMERLKQKEIERMNNN